LRCKLVGALAAGGNIRGVIGRVTTLLALLSNAAAAFIVISFPPCQTGS
jgi:hypothetical protein